MGIKKVELKYCECCGGLMLRPENTEQVYCVMCRPLMRNLAVPKKTPQSVTLKAGATVEYGGGAACI